MTSSVRVPYEIRLFNPSAAEYAEAAKVLSDAWPDYPVSADDLKYSDDVHHPDMLLRRLVAEAEGKVVAVCAFRESEDSYRPGKYIVGLTVGVDHRGQGIGAALYEHMVEYLRARKLKILTANTLENHTAALRFLNRRGFERVMRSPASRLDVAGFEAEPFMARQGRALDRGIEVKSLAVLKDADDDWRRKCWDLSWAIEQDIPTTDRLTRHTLERFSKLFENPNFTPEGWFVALDGEAWIGLHTIWPNKTTPLKYYTGVTGVLRDYRRLGIATALKLHGIAFVRARGGRIIETDNEENNPMFALNLMLGFKPAPAWIKLCRKF